MYFPYFHSFITYFILAISRSNLAQIQWSWTFSNSQDDELLKNVQDCRIWVKFYRVIVKKTLVFFFWFTLYINTSQPWRLKGAQHRTIAARGTDYSFNNFFLFWFIFKTQYHMPLNAAWYFQKQVDSSKNLISNLKRSIKFLWYEIFLATTFRHRCIFVS